MKMINVCFMYFVLLAGCNSFDRTLFSPELIKPETQTFLLGTTLSSNFIPDLGSLPQIQINKIPHPFDVGGYLPCTVWINGKKADLTPYQAQDLAKILNLGAYPAIDDKKLHEGIGWQQPLTDIK